MYKILFAILLLIILVCYSKYIETFDYACISQTDCPADMYCDTSGNGLCVNKLALNETCNYNIQCKYGTCDPVTNRCKKIKRGLQCSNNLDCEIGICDGSMHCN
jgi:hypothetical protein